MRSLFYIFSAMAVMGLAYWAYQENYRTQASLREVSHLQSDIARLRETLGILRAEWAYLNRPERLAELADLNFDRLGLLPLEPSQFGEIDQVAYPPPLQGPVLEPIELQGTLPTQGVGQ